MCDACSETPDGLGRRCNRPDGSLTPAELGERARARHLNSASGHAASGDWAALATSLNNAAAAQRGLDEARQPVIAPTPILAPHRTFEVAPGDAERVRAEIDRVNYARQSQGLPIVAVSVARKVTPQVDPLWADEVAVVRAASADEAALSAIPMPRADTTPARKVHVNSVLAASIAATRLNGGRYVGVNDGPQSVPAQVTRMVAEPRGGAERTRLRPTDEDMATASAIRQWVESKPASGGYMTTLRGLLVTGNHPDADYMDARMIPIVASAISGYQRAVAAAPAPAGGGGNGAPRAVSQSRWLNKPGDKVTVVATVLSAERVWPERGSTPNYLYYLRTDDGDMIRWMASKPTGMQPQHHVTLRGTVRAHSYASGGEKQTEMYYCTAELNRPRQAAG